MTQLILSIPDSKDTALIRKILAKFEGVKVTVPRAKRKNGLDRALEDVAAGRVHQAKDYDDLIYQLNH